MNQRNQLMSPGAEQAFRAEPKCARELFTNPGDFFYVPVYQRQFTWKAPQHVGRLFADATEGISSLLSMAPANAQMFIGAIILLENKTTEQINPIFPAQMPSRVNVIIDGQQRSTALLLWTCALLERIAITSTLLSKAGSDPGIESALETASRTAGLLELLVHEDQHGSDKDYAHYPRMIRSGADAWSKKRVEAKYESPIARILRHTSCWIQGGKSGRLAYSISRVPEPERTYHEAINRVWRFFDKRCAEFANGAEYEGVVPPSARGMADSRTFQEALWGAPWDESTTALVKERGRTSEDDYKHVVGLMRVAALAQFMMNKICFAVVRSDREEWAFDVFDALNTTGEPLTAFETFCPLVTQTVGHAAYPGSDESKHIDRIRAVLDTDANKRLQATEKLVIHAKVLEEGVRLQRRLAVQRQWLKQRYSTFHNGDEQRQFLKRLADLAGFTDVFNNPMQHVQLCGDQQTLLALIQLSDTNHHIVIPVLTSFYSAAMAQPKDGTDGQALAELRTAICATTAFSTLWRLAHGGTEGIDDCFRSLMRGEVLDDGSHVGPFCTQPPTPPRRSTAIEYLADLKCWLRAAGLDTEDAWVRQTQHRPSYNAPEGFARLFLAAAMHDAIPDPTQRGSLKRGSRGTCMMLSASAPWKTNKFDIEHIAPQSGAGGGWDASLYADPSLIHSIGNLTLLPASVNRAIKDWPWKRKRAVMQLLATTDRDEGSKLRQELTSSGELPEFPTLDEIVSNAEYHAHLRPICGVELWDDRAIRARGENLCRLGYQQLSRWLGA